MLVSAFHGTTDSAYRSIISAGFTTHRRNKRPKWLGRGVYFFQDGATYASKWAKMLAGIRNEKAYVLHAKIDLKNCMDFLDGGVWGALSEVIKRMPPSTQAQIGPEAMFRSKTPYEEENLYKNWEDDYYITEFRRVASLKKPIDTVRCAFFEGQPLHKTSWFFDEAHVQICVVNPAAIIPIDWVEVESDPTSGA